MFNMHRKKGTQQHPPEMKAKFTIFFFCYLISFVRCFFLLLLSIFFSFDAKGEWGWDMIFSSTFFFSSTALAVAAIFIMAKWLVLHHFHIVFLVFLCFFLLLLCPRLETYNKITQRYTALSSSISFPIDWTDGIIRNVGKYEMRKLNLLFIFLFRLSCWSHHFSFLVWVPLNERSCNV